MLAPKPTETELQAAYKAGFDAFKAGLPCTPPVEKKQLKVRFGDLTKDNIGQLKRLNLVTFPVRYNQKFYDALIAQTDANLIQLAFHSDVIVGAIACRYEGTGNDRSLYIMTLGVLEAYRGYTIGSRLVKKVIEYAKGQPTIFRMFLHVQVNNDKAIEFYKKFDFEITDKIEGYYRQITPSDGYVVARRFPRENVFNVNA